MPEQRATAPVIVTLPDQIDLTSYDRAYDQLYAAFVSGATMVIADCTSTAVCDCASLRRLAAVQDRAAARDAHLLLVIPPGSLVHRMARLMELSLPVYPSLDEALAPEPSRYPNAPEPLRDAVRRPTVVSDIIDLTAASHLHVLHWQAQLGELRRGLGASPPALDLVAAWDTVAALINLDMRAEDEICAMALYSTTPEGRALARQLRADHQDLAETIAETSLRPPGSPQWWQLASTALSAWAVQCDHEEHGPPAAYRRSADPAVRQQLGWQWRAFREACIRDGQYPDAPPQVPTCQLRLTRPATPRLSDPAFCPLACTCQDCTGRLGRIPVPG